MNWWERAEPPIKMTFREFDQYRGIRLEMRFGGPNGSSGSFNAGEDDVEINPLPNNDYPDYLEGHYRHWTGSEWIHIPNDPEFPVGLGELKACNETL